jgi:hypothetical protein
VIFSYNSKKLNLFDLTSGKLIELLNIININDLKINVRGYNLQQKLPIDHAFKHLIKFYIDDLVQNQKVNIVKAIGPIRSLVNVSGAIYGLFRKPYKAYMSDKGLIRGFGEGAYEFYSVIKDESGFITSKVRYLLIHFYLAIRWGLESYKSSEDVICTKNLTHYD